MVLISSWLLLSPCFHIYFHLGPPFPLMTLSGCLTFKFPKNKDPICWSVLIKWGASAGQRSCLKLPHRSLAMGQLLIPGSISCGQAMGSVSVSYCCGTTTTTKNPNPQSLSGIQIWAFISLIHVWGLVGGQQIQAGIWSGPFRWILHLPFTSGLTWACYSHGSDGAPGLGSELGYCHFCPHSMRGMGCLWWEGQQLS